MPRNEKTPPGTGGAFRYRPHDHRTPDSLSLDALRAKVLIAAHAIRPELAAMLATLAFGGGAHG
ncbi:MAG: hypothetical protein ABJA20_09305 [Novosphingobium sp.]